MIKFLTALIIYAVQAGEPPPCDEANGHVSINWNCLDCFQGCKTCYETAWYECNSCYSGYHFLNSICLSNTPLSSTQFLLKSQINLGMELNGIIQIGSNNLNVYPNFDPNDPIPAYLRGYYFHENSYMTSDKFNLSPWFTISFWIKPLSPGNIFLKRNSTTTSLFLSISLDQSIEFWISLNNGNTISLTNQPETYIFDTWNQIAIACELSKTQWYQNAQLIHNGKIVDQYQDPSKGYYNDQSIGFFGNDPGGSNTFTGFFYKIGYYDNPYEGLNDYYPQLNCTSGCLSCASDLTCPDDCDFNQFNENGVCIDCLSECTYGCRTSERCNLCETKECNSCNDFFICNGCVIRGSLENSKCECSVNSFFNETTQICDLCDNQFCSQCLTLDYFDCKICEFNYHLIDEICLKEVPTGWNSFKQKPYIATNSLFGDGRYQGSYDIFTTGKYANYYPPFWDPETIDPFPIESRGLYFSDGKYLESSQEVYFSHSFTLIFCINPKDGDFFMKGNTTINSNGKASIFLQDPLNDLIQIVTHSDFPLKNWTYFTLIVTYNNSTTTLSTYSNKELLFLYTYYPLLFRDEELSYITLGKSQDSIFDGFIYSFQLFIGEIDILSYINNNLNLNSLPLCDYDYTYDQNNNCIPCEASCSIGCIRSSNCNLCYDQLCRNCSGFLENSTCFQCTELAHNLYPNECICDDNAFLIKNSSNYYCENCDINYCAVCDNNGHFECLNCSFGVLVDTVCLDEYPIGYYECLNEPCLATEIDPHQGFSENYGIFISGSNKGSYYMFNDPEEDDPIPAIQRGFYLDGISKYFQTENSSYIGHIFAFGGWFCVLGTGDILEHQNRLLLASNGSLSITLQDRNLKEFTFDTPGMNFSEWTYLSFGVLYANSTTSISVFLNNIEIHKWSFENLLYRDIPNSKIFLGKSQQSLFNGFIYSFKMWNYQKIDFSYEFDDEICGEDKNRTCLLLYSMDEYYQIWEGSEPSFEKCLPECDRGCIRKDKCNICQDVLCAVCPYFGPNLCIECVPYANGTEKCQCIKNYCLSLNRLSCIKVPYANSNEKYWVHSIPDTTVIVGQWSGNFTINTIHQWIDSIQFINNDNVTFSSQNCEFSPFNENFTCTFQVFVDPSYNNKNSPISIFVRYKEYIYPIKFSVYYDDFSASLMNQPERLGVLFYLSYNYIQVSPEEWLYFNDELCSDENCTHAACEKLLTPKSIASLGKNIDCVYTGLNEILIRVEHLSDNIDSITFREKVFFSFSNETNLKHLNIPWKYISPPMPTALIEPILETCCSCNVIFDGSRSPTRLGSLKYKWILSNYMLYSGDDTQRIANITLESCNIAKEHPYFNLTLIVTDSFGQQASSSITINMTYEDIAIKVWKEREVKVRTDSVTKFKFDVQKSSKIHLDENPLVIWKVSGKAIYESTGIEFVYLFSEKGEYQIVVEAFFNDKTFKVSANASITASPPPLSLVVYGVNTYDYSHSNITINITAISNNENMDLDKGFAFIKKIYCRNGDFTELAGDSFKLDVFNKKIEFNCSFTIKLRDYPDFESEIYWIYVVEGYIPRVYIVSMFPYLDPSSPVRLIADVPDSLRMNISWKEKYDHPFIATTPLNQPSITIQENSILCGIDYEFEIIVADPETGASAKASIKRYANCPPNSGTFEIDPSEGSALDSIFNILFAGWNDLEGDGPLYYQVFKQKDGRIYAQTPKTSENSFQIVLGEKGKTKLIGRIYDSRGTFSEVEAYVEIKDPDYIDAKERSEVLLSNGTKTMDSNMLISSIISVSSYAFRNIQDQHNLTSCVQNLVGTLNKWMNSSMSNIGLSDSSTVLDTVHSLLGKSENYETDLLLDIHSTQGKALNHTKILDFHSYKTNLISTDKIFGSLKTSLSSNNSSSSATEAGLFKLVNQTLDEGNLKYFITTNPNEPPVHYTGEAYNSTTLSVNGKSLNSSIAFNSPISESSAQFKVDTSKNPGSTAYIISILSVAPFYNISDSLQDSISDYYVSSQHYEVNGENVVTSDSFVNKLYTYSNELKSGFVQSSISKNTGTLINPVVENSEIIELNNEISYEAYDENLEPLCSVYDTHIGKFSFKFCSTVLKENGVAACSCETVGLTGIIPCPAVISALEKRVETVEDLGIPTVNTIPVFFVYGFFIALYLITWKVVKNYDELSGKDLKNKVLGINEIIMECIKAICNEDNKLDSLLETWESEKWDYSEDEDYNNSDKLYYRLKKSLIEKLDSLVKDKELLCDLLTPENVRNYIKNCIDKRNLDDLKIVIDTLWKNHEEFKEKVKALLKEQIETLQIGKLIRWYKKTFKFGNITNIMRSAIILAVEAKKETNKDSKTINFQEIFKEKNNKEKLNIEESVLNGSDIYAKVKLESISYIILSNSIKDLKNIILDHLKKKINLESSSVENNYLEGKLLIKNQIIGEEESKDLSSLEISLTNTIQNDDEENKAGMTLNYNGIDLSLNFVSDDADSYEFESSSFLFEALIKIEKENINNIMPNKTFIKYFIKNNDILGVWLYTNLNSPREFRLTYLLVAVLTEIWKAISAFDNYDKYEDKTVDLSFIIVQEQLLTLLFISGIFGLVPLFLKLFFDFNILSTQFEKNKLKKGWNKSIYAGFFASLVIIIVEICYSISKLQRCSLSNFDMYLAQICNGLIIFIILSGIVLPLIFACFEKMCCCSIHKYLRKCKKLFERIDAKVTPEYSKNDYA